jgi:hemolysin-activating ACP:hemolysin acyltransferase
METKQKAIHKRKNFFSALTAVVFAYPSLSCRQIIAQKFSTEILPYLKQWQNLHQTRLKIYWVKSSKGTVM